VQLTLTLPDDLVVQLRSNETRFPRILALGLQEMDAEGAAGYKGLADILEFLADLPSPELILALRPCPRLREEIDRLLERSRETGLTD